jgi:twitching motility protein PilT
LNDALRQDPNLILVGEMRTRDTLEAALVAAETGHLVLSTLHTNGGYQTISRIISEFEKERHEFITKQLAMNLICVVSQRLLPRIDEPGRVLCYEILEVQGAIKSALMSGVPERIPNAMTPQNSIKWNEHLRGLLSHGIVSQESFAINRMNEQD